MKQLKSITLSNIRRFGAETKIELSPGATILLAPNGTGKTAVFEAIEFGLTGKISRLEGHFSPIIRDAQTMARVSLDFGDMQASAQVDHVGKVVTSGDLSEVFPGTDPDDIPFLLRLTHLLDQREGEWLVKADPKTAGSQLERLPIGKDGAQVVSALGGVRRTLHEQLKAAKASLETLEAEFEQWQELIQGRDQAAAQSQGALRSKENIADSIFDIARQVDSLDQLPVGLLVPPLGQDGLETVHDALEQLVQNQLDTLRDRIKELTEVDGLIARFVSEQSSADQSATDLSAAIEELGQKKQDRSLAVQEHEHLQDDLAAAENEREVIAQQLDRYVNEAKAKESVDQRTQTLQAADDALVSAESVSSSSRSLHEDNEQLTVQHDLINGQRKALLQVDADLATARLLLERWESTLQHLADVTDSISGEELHEATLEEQLRAALSLKAGAEAEEQTAKSHHETLTSAADSICHAVASIAAHLPSDRGDCPLCGEVHGALELHNRVNKALEAIDPSVVEAERRAKTATDSLRICIDGVAAAEAQLNACRERISDLESQQAHFEAGIDELKLNVLLGGDTVPLAKESIRRRDDVNAAAKLELDQKQQNLSPPASPDVFEQTKNLYETAVRALDSARQARSDARSRLEQATAALAAITANAPPARTLEDLSAAQNLNANQITDLNSRLMADQSALDRQKAQLSEVTIKVSSLETQLSDAQARLATIRATWRQLLFAGDPMIEVARSHEAQLQSTVNELGRHSDTLKTIKIEIGSWSKLEQTRVAQGFLDRQCGGLSEDEFSIDLSQRREMQQSALQQVEKLYKAMESLNQFLSSEIANVQKHVQAVMPRWQALLKRVVREQRFTGTKLSFRSTYQKARAEVSVPLHDGIAPVPMIASEAQLTDLQLTFLLSMALEHQWSSWRGLLLDDPTQHHDLVHASSVFDVLRDYIVDHGFQVVIATHDALQARYFMRKLQNDGIEARIWSLAPTPEGVTASETTWLGRPQLTASELPVLPLDGE